MGMLVSAEVQLVEHPGLQADAHTYQLKLVEKQGLSLFVSNVGLHKIWIKF